jgi:hypothetical protein
MQDFGKIKDAFNSLLIEGIAKKDDKSKKIFKNYLRTIKNDKILKTQFMVYNNIETKVDSDFNSASLYVNENLKLLKKYKISDIVSANKKLSNLLPENVKIDNNEKKLYESLNYLICTETTPKNVDKISEELKNVINYINNNKPKQINENTYLPNSFLMNIMVQKLNEKYADINTQDREIINVLVDENVETKKAFYNKAVNECVSVLDKLLENNNDESKDKLIAVKKKLCEEKVQDNQLNEKILKVLELKNNIKS